MFGLFGPPDVDKLKAKGDVQRLIKALDYKEDAFIRETAAEALGEIKNSRAVEPLIAALKDGNEVVRRSAVKALAQIGDRRAVEPLIAALKDSDNFVRYRAADALGQIGDARAVEPLIASLMIVERNMCCYAAQALGALKDPRAVEPLIALLKQNNSNSNYKDVRLDATEALDKIGWQPGKDEASASFWISQKEWSECIAIGAPAVEPLIAALKGNDVEAVAEALGRLGDVRAVEPLIATLKDKRGYVRANAAKALGQIKDIRAVEPLVAASQDFTKESVEHYKSVNHWFGDEYRSAEEYDYSETVDVYKDARQAATDALREINGPRAAQLKK